MALNSRGRGPSDYDKNPLNYDILVEANDVIHALAAAGLPEAIFIGTSRGGLLTMAIAALRPNLIAGAVLNDIGPVIDAMGIARIKTYLNSPQKIEDWEDAVGYLKTANYGHFTTLTEENWKQFGQMTFGSENGRPKRDYDIAIAKGLEAVDLNHPLPSAWPQFLALSHCPVLVLRGEHSDILQKKTAIEMVSRHPDCQFRTISGHGHAPLFLDETVNGIVADFLTYADKKHATKSPSADPAFLSEDNIIYLDLPQTEPNEDQALENEDRAPDDLKAPEPEGESEFVDAVETKTKDEPATDPPPTQQHPTLEGAPEPEGA